MDRDERFRERVEERVFRREKTLYMYERWMQGNHEVSFPPQKNHLFHFEMSEVTRVNKWRPNDAQLDAPTLSMYDAGRLARYLPKEQRGVRAFQQSPRG
jgi:hypothetical protein